MSATIPNCVSYDPTFSHEVAVIVQDGLRRMYAEQEDVFYYLTVMNENYHIRPCPRAGRTRFARASSAACTCCGRGRHREGRTAGSAAGLRHHPA